MLQTPCVIRDYNASADTVSVELTGLGAVEAWVDGVGLSAGIDRSLCVFGAQALVNLPDLHRICNATVIEVYGPKSQSVAGIPVSSSGSVITEVGRVQAFTDGAGHATGTVTFPQAFVSAPQVAVVGDNGTSWTVSGITNTGFTFTLAVAGQAFTYVYFSWRAVGN